MQGFFNPKPFDKILWVDPNNVTKEQEQFQFIFGKEYIKLHKLTTQALEYAQTDPHSKFIVMVSHKVFSGEGPNEHRQLLQFQEIPNVYPRFIIFCGDKKKGKHYQNPIIYSFQDDVYEVKEAIENISKHLSENSMSKNKSKLILATDKKFESQLKVQALKIMKNLYWESIEVQIYDEDTLRDTLDSLDNKSEVIVFSFFKEILATTIEDRYLGEYQMIKHWYMITDEEDPSEDPQGNGFTLYHVNIKKLKEKLQQMSYQF